MKFNPSFLQLFPTIDDANNFHASIDNANPSRSWLKFIPNEVYNQYIILQDEFKTLLELNEIVKAELVDLNGNIVNPNLGHGYKKYEENNLLFSFKILNDYKDQCLSIRLIFTANPDEPNGRARALYSNLFTCNKTNRERTSLVSYWHTENHYGIQYIEHSNSSQGRSQNNTEINLPTRVKNQIRLPLYFLRWKTEQDSSESTYTSSTPTNINISRVKRREIKNWRVIANDWINQRLAIVSDSDFVYIDTQREITRPYEYSEVDNGGDFSISILESQPKYGDNYIDENGLVNHRPVITSITFPNGSCCTPDGTPILEPQIISESILTDVCAFQGISKRAVVQGQPNNAVKYRLSVNSMQGTSKLIRVNTNNGNAQYIFNSTSQVFIGYFLINPSGMVNVDVRCCLEECTPGTAISIDATLELYENDGITLSGEACNISASKTCPLPIAPIWELISSDGSSIKTARIKGEPNSTAKVNALITLCDAFGLPIPPPNELILSPYFSQQGVILNDSFDVDIPLNSAGYSEELRLEVFSGFTMPGVTVEIVALYTIYNIDNELSNQSLAVFHRQN